LIICDEIRITVDDPNAPTWTAVGTPAFGTDCINTIAYGGGKTAYSDAQNITALLKFNVGDLVTRAKA
jgi:hypothetical protein